VNRTVVWEVTASQFETLGAYAGMLANTEISQQDYLERLRQMGMPEAPKGSHVRIVLRTSVRSRPIPVAALRNGVLPGLPH
jgi:hypothetical protein